MTSENSLKTKSPASLGPAYFWAAFERFGALGVQFGIGIALARLLTPADYGLVGMVTIFTLVAGTLTNAGFSQALVQKKTLTPADESTAFCATLLLAVVSIGLIWILAPAAARFYDEPRVTLILRVSAFQLIPMVLTLVQNARLTRALDFRTTSIFSMIGAVVGGATAITMAVRGAGVWALVVQPLVSATSATALMWWKVAWRPSGRPSWESFTGMFRFGVGSLGSGLLSTGFDNLYAVLTGRLFGKIDLGLLTRANQLQQLPVNTATSIMSRITFPLLAREQEDTECFLRRLRQCIRHTATWHFPIMLGLAAVAPALIVTLYSANWEGSVPFLQVLAFAGLLYPVSAILVNSMLAKGRSGFVLWLDLIKKPFLLIFLLVAAPHGAIAIALAMTAYTFVCFAVNVVAVSRTTQYSPIEMLRDLWPSLFAATFCAVVAFCFGLYGATHLYQWLNLAVQVMLGVTAYLFVIFLGRRGVYSETWGLLSYARARIPGLSRHDITMEER